MAVGWKVIDKAEHSVTLISDEVLESVYGMYTRGEFNLTGSVNDYLDEMAEEVIKSEKNAQQEGVVHFENVAEEERPLLVSGYPLTFDILADLKQKNGGKLPFSAGVCPRNQALNNGYQDCGMAVDRKQHASFWIAETDPTGLLQHSTETFDEESLEVLGQVKELAAEPNVSGESPRQGATFYVKMNPNGTLGVRDTVDEVSGIRSCIRVRLNPEFSFT